MTGGMPGENLMGRLFRHAEARPDWPAYQMGAGGLLTYEMLAERVATVAAALRRQFSPGAVIILSCANQLAYPVAFLGILAGGCTVFPVACDAADAELLRAAQDTDAVGAIGDERAVSLLGRSLRCVIPIERLLTGLGPGTCCGVDAVTGRETSCGPQFGALLLQSSGTTALPKIVRRCGNALDAVARATAEAVGFGPLDRVLMTVPLTHSFGLEHGALAPVWAGSCVHLCRGLDLSVIIPELGRGGITLFPGVPSTFEMIGSTAETGVAMPTLRAAYSAGGPLPRSVFDTFEERFGIRIAQLYGASEIGSVTFNAPGPNFDPASVGLPFGGVSIRILHPDTNAPLPTGAQGQIAIRAASMFSGYVGVPAELIDGYFPTGDLGRVDASGRLYITGRIKLLIDVGGLKVNPLEVEAVLAEHPAVSACVVVAVKQSQTVYRLKAVITPRHAASPPEAGELRRFAKSRLAAYKVPRLFELRESLPRSPTGKIMRHLVEAT